MFSLGIIGSLVLVLGAAWPEKNPPKHAVKSVKNWLFAVGALCMFAYAFIGYVAGGPIFFVFLEALVIGASIMMMLDFSDSVDLIVISLGGCAFTIWSLFLFEDYSTLLFIGGLIGISFGYTLEMGSRRRSAALTIGSALIALFSYLTASWIFFWLNVFFALFSAYYLLNKFFVKQ